ncbi:MAG: VCBS domain-containing protein, partial [Vulcanococcus sp.]
MVSPGSGTAAGAGGSAPAPGPSANKAAPLVASLLSSGGTEEDAQLTASGQIQLQGGWHAQVVPGVFQGIYGLLSVDASGHWSYQLDNGSPAVQRLNNGEVVQEHFHCLAV